MKLKIIKFFFCKKKVAGHLQWVNTIDEKKTSVFIERTNPHTHTNRIFKFRIVETDLEMNHNELHI